MLNNPPHPVIHRPRPFGLWRDQLTGLDECILCALARAIGKIKKMLARRR